VQSSKSGDSKISLITLTFLVLLIILIPRLYLFFNSPKPFEQGDRIRIKARLLSEPIRYERNQYFRLEGLKVYLPLYPEVSYGDWIIVEGVVLEDRLSEGSLIGYEKGEGFLLSLREKLLEFYTRTLSPPHSSLVSGMVLGSKSQISETFWGKLKDSGTAHVVVASGMNVSLTGGFLLGFFGLFWMRKIAILATLLGIWTYVGLSGFDAPIVRAGIMGTIAFSAQVFGRLSQALKAVFVSALFMLLANPSWAADLGFLLSFFATTSLIVFQPKLKTLVEKSFNFGPQRFLISPVKKVFIRDFSTSLAAQIGVFPILYYYFGGANPLSPFINAIVLWTVAPITAIGMLSGVLGLVFEPLGRAILYLTYPLTWYFVNLVGLFG